MPRVLTAGSTLACTHNGTVQLAASQQQLKVAGQAVLVVGNLEGVKIVGCETEPNPQTNSVPCTSVVSMDAGAATSLKVGGKPVLLDTASGLTNGRNPKLPGSNTWSVQDAGQTSLGAR